MGPTAALSSRARSCESECACVLACSLCVSVLAPHGLSLLLAPLHCTALYRLTEEVLSSLLAERGQEIEAMLLGCHAS